MAEQGWDGPGEPAGVVRFGVLGAAAITPAALIRPARRQPRAEVVAVAARDPHRAERFARRHGVPVVHRTYDDLLADDRVDAVYVPLPNGLHGTWTVRSARAGRHVLCEKPFAANATEAAAVAEAVRPTGVVVMEAFHWRYHPLATRLLEVLASGELGELRRVEAWVCFPLPPGRDIRYQLALAGGALMDAGCYAVHLVRTAAGAEPEVVSARADLHRGGVDRALRGELAFPGGVAGRVTCSLWSRRLLDLRLRVEGSEGHLTLLNPLRPSLGGRLRVAARGRVRVEEPPHTSTYEHQLEAFVAAVLDGRPFPTTVDDAVANMVVIDALYRAAGIEPRAPAPA